MGFVVWLAVTFLTIVPMMKLLPHFGINANWAWACVLPFATLILLWVMARRLQELERL